MKNRLLLFAIESFFIISVFFMAHSILYTNDLSNEKIWLYLIASAIFFMLFLLPILGFFLREKEERADTTYSKKISQLVFNNRWLSIIILGVLGYGGYASAQTLFEYSNDFRNQQIAALLSVVIIWGLGFLLLFAEIVGQVTPEDIDN